MASKSRGRDTPSPAKKRRTDLTPVKRGVDFFFKKHVEKNARSTKLSSNADTALMFAESDREDEEWEVKKRRQEEEDELFARELQEMEARREIEDQEFAWRLARDYKAADTVKHENNEPVEYEDLYGDAPPFKPYIPDSEKPDTTTELLSEGVSGRKITLDNPVTTHLEEIYSIPLDKDPLLFFPTTDAQIASAWSSNSAGTPYAFLTNAFILINSTRSRLKIIDYLVNTLRVVIHHDPTSLLPLVWLTTNAIAPPFEGIELNLGGSVISKALVSASGLTGAKLKVLYDKWGDIGDVAFEAKMAVRTLVKPMPLTVKGVYNTLRSIARAKGQGSAETKRRLVERLLVSAKGEEVRYIGRTLVQNVRDALWKYG